MQAQYLQRIKKIFYSIRAKKTNPNKPNFRKARMNASSLLTKDYENEPRLQTPGKQTQSNPMSPTPKRGKIEVRCHSSALSSLSKGMSEVRRRWPTERMDDRRLVHRYSSLVLSALGPLSPDEAKRITEGFSGFF